MNTVQIQLRPGETKYAAILRLLGCKSLAEAINQEGLQNESDPWPRLESRAADAVMIGRHSRRMNKILSLLK